MNSREMPSGRDAIRPLLGGRIDDVLSTLWALRAGGVFTTPGYSVVHPFARHPVAPERTAPGRRA